jgi:hypothetical protein
MHDVSFLELCNDDDTGLWKSLLLVSRDND